VALYGDKPAPAANLLSSIQLSLARRLGAAFEPYTMDQGKRPYERMFSSIGNAFVLMGWPLISIETGGMLQPLDELRRSMNDAGVWHYYHQDPDDVENDFHLVVGHHTQGVTAEMAAESVRGVRAQLSEEVVDVSVGIEQVFIVAADSSTLAPARFVGRLPVDRDQLLDLYG
jgi:hypothetical protein